MAIPAYCVTGSKKKAFVYSLRSGAAEPLGTVFAFLFLAPFIDEQILGIMTCISFDEILPIERYYGQNHLALHDLQGGMLSMDLCLQLLI